MAIYLHDRDLPSGILTRGVVAIDTETMGLHPRRDRLCLVQIADGTGDEHLVRIHPDQRRAPNLSAMLSDPEYVKLFHFARFDVAVLSYTFDIDIAPIYCTKIASKLVRTYTDRHGLRDLVRDLLGIDISKQQQSSDWGAHDLSDAQKDYAASDVRFLHRLKNILDTRLEREGRTHLAQACFDFLPARAALDLAGWPEIDIFAHI